MTSNFKLAQNFDTPDLSAWVALAEKALKGAPFERLTSKTYDHIAIKPLYTSRDVTADSAHQQSAARDPFLPWDMRQYVLNSDPTEANKIALHDLDRGVSSIEFCIDRAGACGVAAATTTDFQALLIGIDLDIATIAIDARSDDLASANQLLQAIEPSARATAHVAFNLDPLSQIMTGAPSCTLAEASIFAKNLAVDMPNATALRADARPVHEGGGSDGQELAVLIASGIAHLRAGQGQGLSASQVNSTSLFTLSVGADVVLEIAKLKAARRLWARVMSACGVADAPMKLQAATSGRMQTIADPWTNILRATCATFAAGAGGADVVSVLPFTSAYEVADERARRIARNAQLILQEETHLGVVADPTAGAWAMEAIADDLAKVAWGMVQDIERVGGLEAALHAGLVQGWVAQTRAARERDIAKRKTALVGVSVYPNLDEDLPATHTQSVTQKGQALSIPPMRLSAPFERLRAKAQGQIFLATLGPIAKFNARSGFARNAFEAGGIKALGGDNVHADDGAILAAFTSSGAQIVCLCGDDATYEARAATIATALKTAGARCVWLAGKGAYEGVDRAIFAGADVLAELTFAHDLLECAA